jgi:hypothetical protein
LRRSVFQTRYCTADDHFTEDDTLSVSSEIILDNSKPAQTSFDGLIMLSYVIFSIVFLGAVYAASMSGGTASGDFASMSVFP